MVRGGLSRRGCGGNGYRGEKRSDRIDHGANGCALGLRRWTVSDPVNKPAHYTRGTIETIDVIEDWKLGFHLGNVIKYISRAGHKDPSKTLEDLKKALWYLQREIARLERGGK